MPRLKPATGKGLSKASLYPVCDNAPLLYENGQFLRRSIFSSKAKCRAVFTVFYLC